MDVNHVGSSSTFINTSSNSTAKNDAVGNEQSAAVKDDTAVTYEKSEESSEKASKKSKPVYDKDKIQKLIDQSNHQLVAFKKMIMKLLNKQGATSEDVFGDKMIEIDEATRAAAQEAIGEDGYYGVKQTSERILDFAKAIIGDDPSKIEWVKKAVMDGFGAAEEIWGGKLPQICYDTLEAVKKGFEEIENSFKN